MGVGKRGVRTSAAAAGRSRFETVSVGELTVTVMAPGFPSRSQSVSVAPGGTTSLDFALAALVIPRVPLSGTVTGQVTSGTGAAIAGATVSVPGTSLSATTDESGNYRLTGVAAGDQSLTVTVAGFLDQTRTVSVTAGATTTLNFSLTPLRVIVPRIPGS